MNIGAQKKPENIGCSPEADALLPVEVSGSVEAPAIEATAALLVDRLGLDGLNVFQATRAAAGQTVFHLHFHLLPRRVGDGMINVHALRGQVTGDLDSTLARIQGSRG